MALNKAIMKNHSAVTVNQTRQFSMAHTHTGDCYHNSNICSASQAIRSTIDNNGHDGRQKNTRPSGLQQIQHRQWHRRIITARSVVSIPIWMCWRMLVLWMERFYLWSRSCSWKYVICQLKWYQTANNVNSITCVVRHACCQRYIAHSLSFTIEF